ncbi:F-box protein pof6 [Golovinomyces cichoracearum]|uniref:F-box protein pof6 n=1 Tax=Golovinomyces cichoracearum TaxID=62708 RepID=A0A420I5C6_9PEZI|nr:F-box protein pof6 [Golovinomyces cichoracearum]
MRGYQRSPGPGGTSDQSIISSLKATRLIKSQPALPMELISRIVDLLPLSDLMKFALTSKKMLQIVYEDARWVHRLKAMGVWDEDEARGKQEENLRMKESCRRKRDEGEKEEGEEETAARKLGISVNSYGISDLMRTNQTLFDAEIEEKQQRLESITNTPSPWSYKIQHPTQLNHSSLRESPISGLHLDLDAQLNVLSRVQSLRGLGRHEFAKIYAVLAPFYYELMRSKHDSELAIFLTFSEPEQQAQMLAQLLKFSKSDWASGWKQREARLLSVVHTFENGAFQEFEHAYIEGDIDGRMHKYAHVLTLLNSGQIAINHFIQKHSMFADRNILGDPMECFNQVSTDKISLRPFKDSLKKILLTLNKQSEIIDRVFPVGIDVLQILLEKFVHEHLAKYVTLLLDKVYEKSPASYAKTVPILLEQSIRFGLSLQPSKNSSQNFNEEVKATLTKVFEPLANLYFQVELECFKKKAEIEVEEWESKLSAQDATTESFFMGNFNRQSDKRDFLSSFKKVVVKPIHVLPLVSTLTTKPISTQQFPKKANLQVPIPSAFLGPQTSGIDCSNSPVSPNFPAPNDELTAKAALMASRLEGIRSLVSIEVALNLIHAAKASIERVSLFILLSDQVGEKVSELCSSIYVSLLQILGQRHVKSGFDKAVDHLSQYNPREVIDHRQGVASLVTFLELVNVGDLISQMLEVFFEQQLCTNKLIDRNDCFDPAAKAKKRFEQILDERVAAGLNKGIDVLMDEVEYLFATVQLPTDYNPTPTAQKNSEVGSSKAAELVVNLVESHTKMLVGSTDKNVLDVFNQEVGLRLFAVLCRHLKRQRISVSGSMTLISDMNLYYLYIRTLKNPELLEYFKALKSLSQIYLIAPEHAKEIADFIADTRRFGGLFRAEEIYEFIERRADWYSVKKNVEKAMYGIGCRVM